MRIAYVTDTAIPSRAANSLQVMKMCQAMAQHGHRVTLLTSKGRTDVHDVAGSIWSHYGLDVQFPILSLTYPKVNLRPLDQMLFAWTALSAVQEHSIDLLFTRHLHTAALASLQGIPTIYEMHMVQDGPSVGLYLRLLRRGRGFRRFIVITHQLLADLKTAFPAVFGDADVVVAPDGVDLERFAHLPEPAEARKRLEFPAASGVVAGYVGHFYPGKGSELVYELAKLCPDVSFMLVGGDPESAAAYRERAQQDSLQNITITGYVPNAEVPIYMAACDVLLLPNQKTVAARGGKDIGRWTSPLKMFEYMATGRPIIASDLPVLREILTAENAVLCPPQELSCWQTALSEIRDGVHGERGRQALRDAGKYTWYARVQKCLNQNEV